MLQSQLEKIESLTKKGRDFRNFQNFEIRLIGDSADVTQNEMSVEGVACVFGQSTTLFEYDGIAYNEMIDSKAFVGCDMSDVIFNYNHSGKVVARTRNKTLKLSVETDGLHVKARLDGTEEGKRLYEEIKGGYIDRMSYAYTVEEESYDIITHTRIITKIKKLYDVSAVDIPAYDTTSIFTRSILDLDRSEMAKLASESDKRKRLVLLTQL